MKIKWRELFVCILLPLITGGLSALASVNQTADFESVIKPPLSPPAILFPIVWSLLYFLMGVSSYIILTSEKNERKKQIALTVYGVQLFFNFFWSIIFFNFKNYLFAFIWLIILWCLVLACIILFRKISRFSAYLLFPYLAWVSFAGYLNLGIYLLN